MEEPGVIVYGKQDESFGGGRWRKWCSLVVGYGSRYGTLYDPFFAFPWTLWSSGMQNDSRTLTYTDEYLVFYMSRRSRHTKPLLYSLNPTAAQSEKR